MSDISILPEGLDPNDEAQLEWVQVEDGTAIAVEFADVKVTMKVPYGKEEIAAWLVAALPSILNAGWDAIEANETAGEGS